MLRTAVYNLFQDYKEKKDERREKMNTKKPRVLVFASGDKKGGGSGFQELVEFSRINPSVLNAEVVGVVSNYENGGVRKKADALKIPFEYWPGPFDAEGYQNLVKKFKADFVMLSGWLKLVQGLDPKTTVNIHPGPLPDFGGPNMYGHYVHEAVIAAYLRGDIVQSAVTMHFVIDAGEDKNAYDKGPIIFQFPVLIRPDDDAEILAKRVNEKERAWQAHILNFIVYRQIWLERIDNKFTVLHRCRDLRQFIPGIYLKDETIVNRGLIIET